MKIEELFQQWCKETGRSGGVLVGKSIREFFSWLDQQGFVVCKSSFLQPKANPEAKKRLEE